MLEQSVTTQFGSNGKGFCSAIPAVYYEDTEYMSYLAITTTTTTIITITVALALSEV